MAKGMLKNADTCMGEGNLICAERILDMLDSRKRFEKDLQKTKEAERRLEWFRKGYTKLAIARQYIASYRTTEAINILEELAKEYAKTPLADKAAGELRTFGR